MRRILDVLNKVRESDSEDVAEQVPFPKGYLRQVERDRRRRGF
jgi:hypothetical protein